MSLSYLLPSGAAGVQLQQIQGTIRNSEWKTLNSNPITLISTANITIPISFVVRVTDVTNPGLNLTYTVATSLQFANGDAFMGINQWLSGGSPANKDYTFYFQSPSGFGVAFGEISSNIVPNYTINLCGQSDDATIIIADTPFVLTYLEIIF